MISASDGSSLLALKITRGKSLEAYLMGEDMQSLKTISCDGGEGEYRSSDIREAAITDGSVLMVYVD